MMESNGRAPTNTLNVEWEERMRMGQLAFEQGNYKEAKRQFEKALEQCPASDPRMSITLLNLAVTYGAAGKDDVAEPLFQQALRLDEQNLPANCRDLAIDFINVGAHYAHMSNYARAEQMYSKALAILNVDADSAKQADIALALNNLGLLYLEQNQNAKAETALQHALEIRQRIFSKDSKEIAESLVNLANLKHSLGKISEADKLYQKAITMLEMHVGPDHPEVAEALEDYADFLRDAGKAEQAQTVAVRAQAILAAHSFL